MSAITCIDGVLLRSMFVGAAKNLKLRREEINGLNVFPVPDGDTGTNMYLTMQAAVDAISDGAVSVREVAEAIVRGSLRGARGNSGVILSQILRGIGEMLASCESVDTSVFAAALQAGVKTAYKAVMRPVEGTILTVVKDIGRQAEAIAEDNQDFVSFIAEILKAGEESLANTPNLLPVLKKAGVVDAGGKGFLVLIEGWYKVLLGEDIAEQSSEDVSVTPTGLAGELSTDETYGYCTEFLLQAEETQVPVLREELAQMGDSLIVIGDGEVIKVHVHTQHPGTVLESALRLGPLTNIKIENMQEQHNHLIAPSTVKRLGAVAVAAGDGLHEIFRSLGVDVVVTGGQTMNPSTDDLLQAVEQVGAENVIILPNNSNIVLTAQQTQELAENCKVFVVPSKNIPEGLAAMMAYNAQAENICDMIENMTENMEYVTCGVVTYATRDFSAEKGHVKQGDIIGLSCGEIRVIKSNSKDAVLDLVAELVDDETEIITVFAGSEVVPKEREEVAALLTEQYPACDVEVHYGGQPLYYYIVSVE